MSKSVDVWDHVVREGINSYANQLKPRISTVVIIGSSKSVFSSLEEKKSFLKIDRQKT